MEAFLTNYYEYSFYPHELETFVFFTITKLSSVVGNNWGAQSSVNKTIHNEKVLDHKIIVVGSSDLATNLAARLDAQLVPAIIDADTLKNFSGAMDGELELIKAVLIDSWTSPMDFSPNPEEVIINMIDAAEIVLNRCNGHNHANAHCELVHFHPFATPSNYVARGLPADLDPSKNQTSWFMSSDQDHRSPRHNNQQLSHEPHKCRPSPKAKRQALLD